MTEETTSPTTMLETTGDSRPPEVTLGDDAGGEPEVVIRLEGDPKTTFSGLCSVGDEQKVLSGQVPKRFEFDLKGRQLSCRIEKRDDEEGRPQSRPGRRRNHPLRPADEHARRRHQSFV